MALTDSLVGYWAMEHAPAQFGVWDKSGNGNHLTAHGAPVLVDGKIGKAIQFNGVDQWLQLNSNAGVNHNGGEFTGFIWFQPVVLAHGKRLIGSVDWGVTIIQTAAGYCVNVSIEEGSITLIDVILEPEQWYFLAFGWHGIENAARGTFAWGTINLSDRVREFRTAWSDPEGPFTIAGTSSGARASVIVDEAAIFRRFVTAQELYAIFNKGKGLSFDQWDAVKPCSAIPCCD